MRERFLHVWYAYILPNTKIGHNKYKYVEKSCAFFLSFFRSSVNSIYMEESTMLTNFQFASDFNPRNSNNKTMQGESPTTIRLDTSNTHHHFMDNAHPHTPMHQIQPTQRSITEPVVKTFVVLHR